MENHIRTDNRKFTNTITDFEYLGIFQKESISLFRFCLALNLVANCLNNTKTGLNIRHNQRNTATLSHIIHVNIKLYGTSQK